MPRPSFQFYSGDWRRNANLARCTYEQHGLWINIMCLMHDSEEYGVLRWPIKEIAQALRTKPKGIIALAEAGVMKGADFGPVAALTFTPTTNNKKHPEVVLLPACEGPVWYSSRMVRDEYVRNARGGKLITEADTQGANEGLTKVVTKPLTNGSLSPNYSAEAKACFSSRKIETTLSQGREGEPW